MYVSLPNGVSVAPMICQRCARAAPSADVRLERDLAAKGLQLEDLEAAAAEDELAAGPTTCPCCGSSRLAKLGEDVIETLEVVPRQWKVVQTVREKFTCRDCEKISQAPAPFSVLPRGFAGPSLLAMILFEKYGQHQPLNRQSERFELGLPRPPHLADCVARDLQVPRNLFDVLPLMKCSRRIRAIVSTISIPLTTREGGSDHAGPRVHPQKARPQAVPGASAARARGRARFPH
jgi:hypothetical protein